MDMDDDAEDRRRLDRARVLVKTPWTPTIRHTVEVHIGDEHFKVFIVEECGGDTHACRRGRRSFCESSEEIDSDESYSGSSTPRSSRGMVDAGLVAEVPATSKPLSIVDPPNNADEDRQTKFLPTGFSDHHYTPGKASISRVQGSRCQATSCDQTPSAVPQPTVTCHRDTQSKCGKQKDIGSATPAEMTELNHAKGKSVLEESCEESTSLGAMGRDICNKAELGDVAETHPTNEARDQVEDGLLKYQITHVTYPETATLEKGESSLVDSIGPNRRMGPSNHTPPQELQPLGLSPKNSKGDTESACKVYSRQRWSKKKIDMGHTSPKIMTQLGMSKSHGQHLQNEIQQGSVDIVSAVQGEDTDVFSETQCFQQATNIWSMAKHLGATGGEDQHLVIQKIKEMEERDKREAERLGVSRNCP